MSTTVAKIFESVKQPMSLEFSCFVDGKEQPLTSTTELSAGTIVEIKRQERIHKRKLDSLWYEVTGSGFKMISQLKPLPCGNLGAICKC